MSICICHHGQQKDNVYWVCVLFIVISTLSCSAEADRDFFSVNLSDQDGDGFTTDEGDCDDLDPNVYPDAPEHCRDLSVDNDCDGNTDESEAIDTETFYLDRDGDGVGGDGGEDSRDACVDPEGYAPVNGDCDDENPLVYPGASETNCTDEIDYNCDGSAGLTDSDEDGFPACEDCDDADGDVFPDAVEVCNGRDDDCDGIADNIDESNDSGQGLSWYADEDGDLFGDSASLVVSCSQPDGYVSDASDCDDTNADINPESNELCNGIDDDCDGIVDEDSIRYVDLDADGYGDSSQILEGCAEVEASAALGGDCDDSDASVFPEADEVCNGIDDDCNGLVDDMEGDDAAGCGDYALSFEGSQFAWVDGSADIHLLDGFTLNIWIKTSDCTDSCSRKVWIAKYVDSYPNGFRLGIVNRGETFFDVSGYELRASSQINDGFWHFISAAYDASDGHTALYVDAALEDEGFAFYDETTSLNESTIDFGAANGAQFVRGYLDEIAIWNYPLTDQEILSSFERSPEGDANGLLMYFPLDEGDGQISFDASSHGFQAVLGTTSGIDVDDPTWASGH